MGPERETTIRRIFLVAGAMFLAAIASAFALGDTHSETAILAARYTARVSFLMFIIVVVCGQAARLWPESIWQTLARNRRHLGLAFAALMAGHLLALSTNLLLFNPRPLSEVVLGGLIYAVIALMALTSNDAAQRRMGKWWKRLHWVGVLAILVAFAESYAYRLFTDEYRLTGMIFAPIVYAALAIRLGELFWRKKGQPA